MFDIATIWNTLRKGFGKKDTITSIVLIALYFFTRLINLDKFPIFSDEGIYIHWAKVAKVDAAWRFISLTDGKQPLQTCLLNSRTLPSQSLWASDHMSGCGKALRSTPKATPTASGKATTIVFRSASAGVILSVWKRATLCQNAAQALGWSFSTGQAAAESGLNGATTLSRPLSARAIGMGQSFASVDGGIDSFGYNPAGLAALKRPALFFSLYILYRPGPTGSHLRRGYGPSV